MAYIHSYAQVASVATIRRVRELPREGEIEALAGQSVKAMEIVARAEIPREHRIIDLGEALQISPERAMSYMLKSAGDMVAKGEAIASRPVLLGIGRRRVLSPVEGKVALVGQGQVLIAGKPERIEVHASVPGRVASVEPGWSVVVESYGALIHIAWGHGGLAWGTLKVMGPDAVGEADPGLFNIDHRGAIVSINAPLTEPFLQAAVEARVRGLIAASMHASLVPSVEALGFPVGLTQGFGRDPMAQRIATLLEANNGRELALDAEMPLGWRSARPGIIIPVERGQAAPERRSVIHQFAAGQQVRVLHPPYLGQIGTVRALSTRPRQLASGLWVEGAEVELASGVTAFVPFANLEYLG